MQSTVPLGGNPFAVLTAVVAPAILTNACSILALGTSNRLARVVDRTRIVATDLGGLESGSAYYEATQRELDGLQVRAQLLVKALRVIYASLGLFAAAALVSVGGSISSYYGQPLIFKLAAVLAFLTGASATTGLCIGCILMVRETRVAMQNLAGEATIRSTRLSGSQSRRGQ
jgi:hypothetical protein